MDAIVSLLKVAPNAVMVNPVIHMSCSSYAIQSPATVREGKVISPRGTGPLETTLFTGVYSYGSSGHAGNVSLWKLIMEKVALPKYPDGLGNEKFTNKTLFAVVPQNEPANDCPVHSVPQRRSSAAKTHKTDDRSGIIANRCLTCSGCIGKEYFDSLMVGHLIRAGEESKIKKASFTSRQTKRLGRYQRT
jgi:hypothetical protein